jgi:hypothetical protein
MAYFLRAAAFVRSASHSGIRRIPGFAASCSGVAHIGSPALVTLSSTSARSAAKAVGS